jgi:flagellar biosynthesis protein FlhF
MKIKKFTARTFNEALALVKKELSQDAIILSTVEKKGLRPQVEVTAAVDYEGEDSLRNADSEMRNDIVKTQLELRNSKSAIQSPKSAFRNPQSEIVRDDGAVDKLKHEIGALRTMIEGLKNNGYEVALPSKKREILNYLRERSVRDEFALRLCDKTSDISDIPLLISSDIKIKRHTGTKKAVMLVGPTGVGKTTTIAKLAAQAVKAGKKAAVINLDTFRIGAVEQVKIYTRILGIPLAVASTAAEFRSFLLKFSEERDVVFIDTTGRNPQDAAHIAEMAGLCKTEVPLELHLLMSANTDDECMIAACRSYQLLPVDYIAFTKIDEAVRYGALYNIMLTYQKPVAYLTTGQRVPGDIEHATVNRLANLIVKKELQPC